MAIIPQRSLLCWKNLLDRGDLFRLELVLDNLPDEEFMRLLEEKRGNGRNEYPVRAVWNSILAGIVFQHISIESLRRELCRNGELREMCGFDPLDGAAAVPSSWAYTRFLRTLRRHEDAIDKMFQTLIGELAGLLPDLGKYQALDGKFIESHGKPSKNKETDGRRDLDAKWGMKQYRGTKKNGGLWESVKKCFGYQLNLLVDAKYELPLAFTVTPANAAEVKQVRPIVDALKEKHPEIGQQARYLIMDRGYDSTELYDSLWKEHGIKAIIDNRNCWNDGEETRAVPGYENVVYDFRGTVRCMDLLSGELHEMYYAGFESARDTLKYRCPASEYGYICRFSARCKLRSAIRIKRSADLRVFPQIPRSTEGWKRLYRMRSAVERVNSRLDVSFGFEQHFIRGLGKMRLRVSLAMLVMLAMATGHIKAGQLEKMRSLIQAA
jgi:hypothetical protein